MCIALVLYVCNFCLLTAFADETKNTSAGVSPETAGQGDMISIFIGIFLLSVGVIGFTILKIKEKQKLLNNIR